MGYTFDEDLFIKTERKFKAPHSRKRLWDKALDVEGHINMRIGLCGPISQIDEIAKIDLTILSPLLSKVQMDSTEYKEALKKQKRLESAARYSMCCFW